MEKRSKVQWRCRRGMRELDLLLQSFLAKRYDNLSEVERAAFDRLLDYPDQDILAWIFGRSQPPLAMEQLVRELQRTAL